MPPYGYLLEVIHNCPDIMNEIIRTIVLCVEFEYKLDKNDLMFMFFRNIPINRKHFEHLLPIDDEMKRLYAVHAPTNFAYFQLFDENDLKLFREIQKNREQFTVDVFKQFIHEHHCSMDAYLLHVVLFYGNINIAQLLLQEYKIVPNLEDVENIRTFLYVYDETLQNSQGHDIDDIDDKICRMFDNRISDYISSDYRLTADYSYLEQKFLQDFKENYNFFVEFIARIGIQ